VGDEPRIKPDHAAHICALGRRSALCNLFNLLVIMFDSPHRAVTHFARALFYKVAAHDLSRSFSKNISSLGWITRNVLTLPEKILFLEFWSATACRRFVTALLNQEACCDKATAGRRTPKLNPFSQNIPGDVAPLISRSSIQDL